MKEIQGQAKKLRELLGAKYAIDYYQRDYKWERKQVQELLDDLTGEFLDDYLPTHPRSAVATYGRYFLGSVILSKKDNTSFIVDGQQRLTTLTLLLIFLRNLQSGTAEGTTIDALISFTLYGETTFNLDVPERTPVMTALFAGGSFDATGHPESVRAMLARYQDIESEFPEELRGSALPYFIDWLIENVYLVEITAYSDDDAYTIFETMNDRGLSLTPSDMLKGYLLTNITDPQNRIDANERWKQHTTALRALGKDAEPDFFKAWLRSQYAVSIATKGKGHGDYDRIGTEFHRWVRDHADAKHDDQLLIDGSAGFFQFVEHDFTFYSRAYQRVLSASNSLTPGLEHVFYNAKQGFTLQPMMLLAPLTPDDSENVVVEKLRLVSTYLDILLTRRVWNYRLNSQSSMYYSMFLAVREIRGLDSTELAAKLYELYIQEASQEENKLTFTTWLGVHQQNRSRVHLILARMTDYIEQQSGMPSHYLEYVNESGNYRYEVEHIWADKPGEHLDEYADPTAFQTDRNRIGGLVLLPKTFNSSYGTCPYEVKFDHYNSQNLLVRSLHPLAYQHNPGFAKFRGESGLPFQPHTIFRKADLQQRRELYRQLAEQIWNPDRLIALDLA